MSSSLRFNTSSLRTWWTTDKIVDTVMKFSADNISVKSASRPNAASSDSRTSTSCYVIIKYHMNCLLLFEYSRCHFCIEAHLVWQPVTRWWHGRSNSFSLLKLCLSLKLWGKVETSFLQTPRARLMQLSFFIEFSTAKFRLQNMLRLKLPWNVPNVDFWKSK